MPTVPSYKSNIQDSGLPNARVSADIPLEAFGAGRSAANLSEATGSLARESGKIIAQEKKGADDLQVLNATAKLTKLKNDLLYNPDAGALGRKGEASFGVINEYGDKYLKGSKDIEDSLVNEEQKFSFQKHVLSNGAELDGILNKHLFQERKQYDLDSTNSYIDSSQQDTILNFSEPDKIARGLEDQRSKFSEHALRNGIDQNSDIYKADLRKILSKTHSGLISRMVNNGQDVVAEDYFKNNKGEMTEQDLLLAEKVVEAGSLKGQSQKLVDSFFDRSLSSQDALSEIKSIENPKLRDEVKTRYENEKLTEKRSKEFEQENLYNDVFNIVQKSHGTDMVPQEQLLSLSPVQQRSIQDQIKRLRSGEDVPPNGEVYYNLKLEAANPHTTNDFMKKNLRQFAADMTNSELHELINIQTDKANKSEKSDPLLEDFRTKDSIINNVLESIDIPPNAKPGSADAEKVKRFRDMVAEQQRAYQYQTGKKATNADFQEIADKLATEVITDKGFLWNSTKRVFELDSKGFETVGIDQIPRGERVKIEDALRKNGLPIKDKNIIDLYVRKLRAQ